MDRPHRISTPRHDTRAWKAQVWISFLTAASLSGIGLAFLPGTDIDRAFMVMGCVFSVSASLRDAHDAAIAERSRGD